MANPDDRTVTAEFADQFVIDELCNEFEESWKRGEAPDISSFLERTHSNLWPTLFIELVQIDMEYRSHKGDAPSVDEYADRFPQFAKQLAAIGSSITESKIKQLHEIREIGGFRLLQRIGSGSFGVVWKAWDPDLEREVAVKLPTERSLSREYANEFRREAKSAAKLSHPGIVRVIDYGVQDGFSYIVYDLIDGINLKQWARRNQITPKDAAALCAKIADAVSHAHANGVVHRDLKPSNVLVDREGQPIVTDFGLAKRDDSASTVGGSGAIVGTFAYMSPEQAEGKSRAIDARSDVYSLGAILYELLSGRQLIQGDPREALHKILNVAPDRLSTIVKGLHPDLETVCHKCLEKRPEDRYRTAAELSADLKRFVAGEPVQARPVPKRVQAWRWVTRHRTTVAVSLLVILPLAALLVVQALKASAQAAVEPRTVHIATDPPGATVAVNPCNPKTGEPDLTKVEFLATAPGTLRLLPGRYRVNVTLMQEGGTTRHQSVNRTVPGDNGEWRSMAAVWEFSRPLSATEIEWSAIELPMSDVRFEMAYVPGTEAFTYNGPDGPKTVSVEPFYVATREFTFGDFLVIRPNNRGLVSGVRAQEQPPTKTLDSRYDMAEHWAEASGCRLLTDLEFAYLAYLAGEAQSGREHPGDASETFATAGGTTFDEILLPGQPAIRGILTGYAEWTGTWVHSPLATIDLRNKVEDADHPEQYRIIRGGTIGCGPSDYPRTVGAAAAGEIYTPYPNIGFRLARAAFGSNQNTPPDQRHEDTE